MRLLQLFANSLVLASTPTRCLENQQCGTECLPELSGTSLPPLGAIAYLAIQVN